MWSIKEIKQKGKKTLKNNLDESLKDINHNIIFDRGRMYIESDNFDEVLNVASKTFGIHEINIGYEFDDINFDNLKNNLISLLQDKEFTTFKVVTKRANKSYPLNSMEISRELGGVVLKNFKNMTKKQREEAIRKFAEYAAANVKTSGNMRASAEYRTLLVEVLTKRTWETIGGMKDEY